MKFDSLLRFTNAREYYIHGATMTQGSQKGRILQSCKGLQIQASNKPGHDATALSFDTDWGVVTVVLDSSQLSLLIAMIIEHANKVAPKKAGEETVTLSFDPIEAQGVGVTKGPTPETAYVSMMSGKVNMTFVIKKDVLQSTYAILTREIL